VIAFVATLVVVMRDPGVDHRLVSRTGAALVISSTTWFIWRVACHPAVVVDDEGLTVVNPFSRHRIPWGSLGDVITADGLELVAADRTVKAWAFSGSLMGDLTGDRSATRAREVIEASRAAGGPASAKPPREHRSDVGLRSLLVFWTASVLLAVLAWWLDETNSPLALEPHQRAQQGAHPLDPRQ